jgi:hypothetical protein
MTQTPEAESVPGRPYDDDLARLYDLFYLDRTNRCPILCSRGVKGFVSCPLAMQPTRGTCRREGTVRDFLLPATLRSGDMVTALVPILFLKRS